MKSNKKLQLILLIIAGIIFSVIISQTYPADEQIFLTDTIALTPKQQPLLFALFVFANIGIFIFSLYLAYLVILLLVKKGILFQFVGILLLLGAAGLTVLLTLGHGIEDTTDYFIAGILILFLGVLGFLMTLGTNKRKSKSKK
jgi:membrane-associated HD superfamily phosphohydrolase